MAYKKENDFTLSDTIETPGGGTLSRVFNFASGTITTVFREKFYEKDTVRAYSSDGGVGIAIGAALTSQMHVQKFSELDSLHEVAALHAELQRQGGNPPPLEDIVNVSVATGKDIKASRAFQLKPPGT
jgi:hypothetical protein